jgi:hypothetical protein
MPEAAADDVSSLISKPYLGAQSSVPEPLEMDGRSIARAAPSIDEGGVHKRRDLSKLAARREAQQATRSRDGDIREEARKRELRLIRIAAIVVTPLVLSSLRVPHHISDRLRGSALLRAANVEHLWSANQAVDIRPGLGGDYIVFGEEVWIRARLFRHTRIAAREQREH